MGSLVRRVLVCIALLAAQGVGSATGVAGAPRGERHCVIEVVGRKPSGEFETTPEQCFSSFSEAAAVAGIPGVGANDSPATLSDAQIAASFAIGIHYDGFSGTGATLTVNGDDCSGGWLNVSATWVNRISSTRNGCYRVVHFSSTNLSGSNETTFGVNSLSNLTGLNNATDSIQYAS
jgi:hypothetical protein